MRNLVFLLIAVVISGCGAPQKKEITSVPEPEPFELYVKEWKEKKTEKTELVNEYIKRKINKTLKKDCETVIQQDIPLENSKTYGLLREEGIKILKKLTLAESGGHKYLFALYSTEKERENLVLFVFAGAADGSYKKIFETKEEGNTFFNVNVLTLGKELGSILYLQYGACVCSPTGTIYLLKAGSSLKEIYSGTGEGIAFSFEDLDGNGTCELVETNSMHQSGDLSQELKEKFTYLNSRVRMMASMVTVTTIYKWDGKEFKNSGILYQ